MSNFLLGGRMGDLIHCLWVVKNTPGKHDLFITDRRDLHSDGFVLPLQETLDELLPILQLQPWFNSLSIYDNQVEFGEGQFNLSMWRRYAYSASWTQLLSNTFGGIPPNGEPWITLPKIGGWQDDIVLHCSIHTARKGIHWDLINSHYSGVFVGNQEEYKAFGYPVPFHQPKSLLEHFQIVNSCKFFIGNQSAPLAMAHALGHSRLAMLNEVDKLHYVGEERWHKDYYWMTDRDHFYEGLKYL